MTSPRTPRQWNAGSEEPRGDVKLFHERHGFVERRRGGWLFVRMPDGTPYPEELHGQLGWAWAANQHWPLSEVLPETPEPPRAALGWAVPDHVNFEPADSGIQEFVCSRDQRWIEIYGQSDRASESLGRWLQRHSHGEELTGSPVPASQSVPAVPVSSTGGKETGEAAEDGTEELSGAADWTEEPRFADFRAAYDYATGRHKAALYVCHRAKDVEDRRELLLALALLPPDFTWTSTGPHGPRKKVTE